MDLPNTDLTDRYLTAIRWNLTGAKADDIIAELGDVIASRVEDREEALGRPLTRDETSALLRDFGHPLVVAGRYGTQQYLIGPDAFPFYWFALKVVMAISLVVVLVTVAAHMVFAPGDADRALLHGFADSRNTLLANAALVTLIFVVAERLGWITAYAAKWKPEQLPDLSDLKLKPKKAWESAFEVAAGVVFLLWWGGVIHFPTFYSNVPDVRAEPAPIWAQLYWPIFALAAAQLVHNLLRWVRPRWRTFDALLGVVIAIAGVALLGQIYKAGEWVVLVSNGMPADKVADIQESLHLALSIAIVVVGVVWVLQALGALWRLWRVRAA